MVSPYKTVRCSKCGWYHSERPRADVELEAQKFSDYITKQPPEVQEQFGYGPLSKNSKEFSTANNITAQEKCFQCGASYKEFIDDDGCCPMGVTMQGIIKRDE